MPSGTDIIARGLANQANSGQQTANAALASGETVFGGQRISPLYVPRLVNALLDAETGTMPAQPIFAFIGDSTMAGTRGTGDLKSNSYPWKLTPYLAQRMAIDENGWYGNQISTTTPADLPAYDPRLTLGAGCAFGSDFSIGGYPVSLDAATGALTFAPTKAYDRLDLILSSGGTASTVGVQFGSGSVNNQVLNTSNYTLVTLTKTLGTEAINITKVAGAPRVQGMTLRNTTSPKVMLANMAKAGSASGDWAATTNNRSPLSVLRAMNPVGALINLGINDWSLGVSVSTFQTNMTYIINQLQPNTDLILSIPFPSNLAAYPTQGQYNAVIRALAAQFKIPLIDYSAIFTSWEVGNPLGRYVDNRHPTPGRGYTMTAKWLNQMLLRLLGF